MRAGLFRLVSRFSGYVGLGRYVRAIAAGLPLAFGLMAGALAAGAAGPSATGVQRSEHRYPLSTTLRLQRADGQVQRLSQALGDGRPVVLTFMYSSCVTVCPITNQTLVEFERLLGPERREVNTVSISIDPDHDSVRKLSEYAGRTGAKGSFYTSDPAASESVQRIFDVWRGDKMNHQPVFLLSTNPQRKWVRLDGLVTPKELMAEYQRLLAEGG